jgi:PTH1 family peptidyl-tRNA hydrolase
VVEVLCARHDATLKPGPSRVRADVADVRIGAERLVLAAPQSFMNESGRPVVSVAKYFKIEIEDLLVIYDDIDLPFGRLKLSFEGGHGGHNGLRSVEAALGTREYPRLKVGVGRPPGRMDPAAYVLKPFSKAERAEVDFLLEYAADAVEQFLVDPIAAQQSANSRRPPVDER